jgi:hypothetical protein
MLGVFRSPPAAAPAAPAAAAAALLFVARKWATLALVLCFQISKGRVFSNSRFSPAAIINAWLVFWSISSSWYELQLGWCSSFNSDCSASTAANMHASAAWVSARNVPLKTGSMVTRVKSLFCIVCIALTDCAIASMQASSGRGHATAPSSELLRDSVCRGLCDVCISMGLGGSGGSGDSGGCRSYENVRLKEVVRIVVSDAPASRGLVRRGLAGRGLAGRGLVDPALPPEARMAM